jgi:hypothetical protein
MAGEASRVLVVAHRTARDPSLVDAVAARAAKTPAEFTLLVPAVAHGLHRVVDPEDHCCEEAEGVLRGAIPVLSEAAGAPISGLIGSHDPYAAVWDALNDGGYDEVIVSTHPSRISRWLHIDLPHRIAALGVAVTHVVAGVEHSPVATPVPVRQAA